jgi:hypothetical protein
MNRRRPQSLGGTQVLPRLAKYTLLPINQSRLARQSGSISQDGNGVLTILTVPTSDCDEARRQGRKSAHKAELADRSQVSKARASACQYKPIPIVYCSTRFLRNPIPCLSFVRPSRSATSTLCYRRIECGSRAVVFCLDTSYHVVQEVVLALL